MVVRNIDTKEEFDTLIGCGKLVVVDFYATWCGPCKVIGPKVEAMSKEFPDIEFVKVDVDENDQTAEACGITAMPTFQLYKDGKKVAEFTGANEAKLKELVQKHS